MPTTSIIFPNIISIRTYTVQATAIYNGQDYAANPLSVGTLSYREDFEGTSAAQVWTGPLFSSDDRAKD